MKLASSVVAASAVSFATAVWSPPAPEPGQELMDLWVSLQNEAAFMQQEIALGRSERQCKDDCNTEKEVKKNFNRGRCQKNCGQIADKGGFSGDKDDRRPGRSGCDEFSRGSRREQRCKEANKAGDKKSGNRDTRRDDDDDDRRGRRNNRRGDNLFYKGMCGKDADDDLTYVDNFCDDIDDDLCRGASNSDIKDFCKWLFSNSKSFSNNAYSEDMCDRPSGGDRSFCNKIDDKLCDKKKITRQEKDLCDWLYGDLLGAEEGEKKDDKTSLRAALKK